MVDALRAAHRRIRRGGLVIDVRPDHTREARIVAHGRVRALLQRSRDADMDRHADAAVESVLESGLYRRLRIGRIWYGSRFTDLAELERSITLSVNYCRLRPGARRSLAASRPGPLTMRRAVKFAVMERI
jgi:hypothetical protein